MRKRGIEPASNQITVDDRRLRRMRRDTKVRGAKALPEEDIKRLPDIIIKPKAVLWDIREAAKGRPALLYVFDPSGGDRMGKIFVRVGFTDLHRRLNTNSVRSAGLVPKLNLQEKYAYQIILGGLD